MPLLPDYVVPESLGKANAYITLVMSLGLIIGSSGADFLSEFVDLIWIYIGYGIINILASFILAYGIKDVILERKKKAKKDIMDRLNSLEL